MPWLVLGSGVMVAQRPLEPLILVRVQAPQLIILEEREPELIINFQTKNEPQLHSEPGLLLVSRSLISLKSNRRFN